MRVTAKVELFDVEKLFDSDGPQEFAAFARAEIARSDAHNTRVMGRQLPREEFVDGVEGKPLSSVRKGSIVVATWEFGEDLVRWVYEALREKSPVLRGTYRDSISIFADGAMVASPREVRSAEEVVIIATVPYARKLEGPNPKHMSDQAPDGVFNVVATLARQRFGNQANIRFTYRGFSGGNTMMGAWAGARRARNSGAKANRQFQKDVRNPAVLINFR